MTHSQLVVEPAVESGEVVAILSEAARRLRERGIQQWPDPFPDDRVTAGIRRGEVFLARLDGRSVGTLTLQAEDELFWGAQPPVALYLHRLAVCPGMPGTGVRLVDWAAHRVVECGRRLLRLDCMAANPGIRSYYERLGFVQWGETDAAGFHAALYERECPA